MEDIFAARRRKFGEHLKKNGIAMAVFEDCEERRNPSVRYFSAHPSDAILAIFPTGEGVLSPWDEILAGKIARCDKIIPFTKFERDAVKTVAALAANLKSQDSVELPCAIPVHLLKKYEREMPNLRLICQENGADSEACKMRSIKDAAEIETMRKAAKITDEIADEIEIRLKKGEIRTEIDAALLIERLSREKGCEGTSFDTLAAGPSRSFGIHAFPNFSDAPFGTDGLSILDFGVKFQGYASDITLAVAKNLSAAQQNQLDLVLLAYEKSLEFYRAGLPTAKAAAVADEVFAEKGRFMPHGLGHGVGLEVHEFPHVSPKSKAAFEEGMIVTLEPGLYDEGLGGCRFENDVLITRGEPEVITHSKVIRL